MPDRQEIRLTSYYGCRDALRSRDLRQGLYDEGVALMDDVIVNLHGDAHRSRRRLENRLFRRDTFAFYEREVLPQMTADALAPALAAGTGDLISLSRHVMMNLAAEIAGIDRPDGTQEEFEQLYDIMGRLARASTIVHATGDKQVVQADGQAALAEFEGRFYRPSLARRRALLARFDAGEISEEDLPRDVLMTLLCNVDRLDLADAVVLRETAYFPWVGAHSTSHAFTHAMHHVFRWCDRRPEDLARLRDEPDVLQRFVHEALRLHPASPEALRVALADIRLPDGTRIPAGARVTIDLVRGNRDRDVFGPDAEEFDPSRTVPEDVPEWGLTFGSGFHACLGQELAGGLGRDSGPSGTVLHGAITVMAGLLLQAGARLDPSHPPLPDSASVRPNFSTFPVAFPAPVGAGTPA